MASNKALQRTATPPLSLAVVMIPWLFKPVVLAVRCRVYGTYYS